MFYSNDSDFFPSGSTITGIDFVEFDTIAQFIRVKVTTPEGVASTCNVKIASK